MPMRSLYTLLACYLIDTSRRLICNIPYRTSEDEVDALLRPYGAVGSVELLSHARTGLPNGCAPLGSAW